MLCRHFKNDFVAMRHAGKEELTEIVHGTNGLEVAKKITETFFHGSIKDLSADELRVGLSDAPKTAIEDGIGLLDAMVACGIAKSKSNARTLVQQGSILVNGDKVTDIGYTLSRSDAYDQEFTILKKGKKNWYVVTF